MRKQINCTSVIGTMIASITEVLFLNIRMTREARQPLFGKKTEELFYAKKKSNTDISFSASAP